MAEEQGNVFKKEKKPLKKKKYVRKTLKINFNIYRTYKNRFSVWSPSTVSPSYSDIGSYLSIDF